MKGREVSRLIRVRTLGTTNRIRLRRLTWSNRSLGRFELVLRSGVEIAGVVAFMELFVKFA